MFSIFTLLLAFPFMWNQLYYIYNKQRLDTSFKNRDIESIKILDLIHFFLRTIFYFWMIWGALQLNNWVIGLLLLHLLSVPLFHLKRMAYIVWNNILPIITIIGVGLIAILSLF